MALSDKRAARIIVPWCLGLLTIFAFVAWYVDVGGCGVTAGGCGQ